MSTLAYDFEHRMLFKKAQERLILAGFDPGPIDGVLGPKTQAALREYQAAHGLQTTGTLDEKTRNAMGL